MFGHQDRIGKPVAVHETDNVIDDESCDETGNGIYQVVGLDKYRGTNEKYVER